MDELGYKPCKVDGCLNRIEKTHGPYGGLCVMHAMKKKAARFNTPKRTRRQRSVENVEPARHTLIDNADRLPDLTRVLQERTEAFHAARAALRDAVVEYDKVLKEMSVSAAELLGKDRDDIGS